MLSYADILRQQLRGRQVAPPVHAKVNPKYGGGYGSPFGVNGQIVAPNGGACCGSCATGMPCEKIDSTLPPGTGPLASRAPTVQAQGCLIIEDVLLDCPPVKLCRTPPLKVHCQSQRVFTANSFDGQVFVLDSAGQPCPDFVPQTAGCNPQDGAQLYAIDQPGGPFGNVIFVANIGGEMYQWNPATQQFREIDDTLKACKDYRPVLLGNPTVVFNPSGGQGQIIVPRRCDRETFTAPNADLETTDKTTQFCPPV